MSPTDVNDFKSDEEVIHTSDSKRNKIFKRNSDSRTLELKSLVSKPLENLEGSWEQMKDNRPNCFLIIKSKGPGKWGVRVRVGNTLSCTVMERNGTFYVGPVTSTNLLIPSYMHDLEIKLAKLLSSLTKISLDGMQVITITSMSNDIHDILGSKLVLTAGDRREVFDVATQASQDMITQPASQAPWMYA